MLEDNQIQKKRKEIDDIDCKILSLINKRAKKSLEIRNLKSNQNIALYDSKREEHIIKQLCDINDGPLYNDNVEYLFKEIIKIIRGLPNDQ